MSKTGKLMSIAGRLRRNLKKLLYYLNASSRSEVDARKGARGPADLGFARTGAEEEP